MLAALFDFDGVIVDSTPIHLAGWEKAYWELFQRKLDEATLASLVGRSTAAIGTILGQQSGFPTAKAELIKRKVAFVLSSLEKIPLIEGAREFLAELQRRQLPFGIVSNAPRSFIAAAIERHKLAIPFYLGLEDYHRPKPDAEPYMKGAIKLGFPFERHASIFVFEDSTHGIAAALAAHMTAIGICSQHPPELLLQAGAKQCFDDLEAALQLMD